MPDTEQQHSARATPLRIITETRYLQAQPFTPADDQKHGMNGLKNSNMNFAISELRTLMTRKTRSSFMAERRSPDFRKAYRTQLVNQTATQN